MSRRVTNIPKIWEGMIELEAYADMSRGEWRIHLNGPAWAIGEMRHAAGNGGFVWGGSSGTASNPRKQGLILKSKTGNENG